MRVINDIQLTGVHLVPADQAPHPCCIIRAGTVLDARPGKREVSLNRDRMTPEAIRKLAEECGDPITRNWLLDQLEDEDA